MDADPAMVATARVRFGAAEVVVGALPALPFADDVFGAVGANFVVNHTEDPRAAVAELIRVCLPPGRVALTIWPERLIEVNQLWNEVMLAAGVVPPSRQGLPTDLWRAAEGGIATIGAVYRAQSQDARATMRRAYDEITTRRTSDGLLVLGGTAPLAAGTAPAE